MGRFPALWEQVNRKHAAGARQGRPHAKVQTALAGLLQCAACGFEMCARYTAKAGVRYLYYVCRPCQKSMRPKPKPVASTNLEGSLLRELEPLLGRQPTNAHIRQSIERLSYHPSTG